MPRLPVPPLLALAALLAVALSGCVGAPERTPSPGELQLSASWRDAQHMQVDVTNVGGMPMGLSGMENLQVTGPEGRMSVHWNGMAPTLAPGESRSFELHAMHMDDGTMGMTMDHAMAGAHMPMPAGDYLVHMGGKTALATLG